MTMPPLEAQTTSTNAAVAIVAEDTPKKEGGGSGSNNKKRPRRSTRGNASIRSLAELIVKAESKVVVVTGAGVSVVSGVRPFRSHVGKHVAHPKKHGVLPTRGLWNDVIWSMATREAFRKDPLRWYNEFWIPHFMNNGKLFQNMAHIALQELLEEFPKTTTIITQNIDGLQPPVSGRLIEAHGRIGLWKCLAEEDSDTDSDSDDDEERPVHLGHRRKSRELNSRLSSTLTASLSCPYRYKKSLEMSQLEPPHVRLALQKMYTTGTTETLKEPPLCPFCRSIVLPQALLFDEGYHSHAFYEFERMESVLENADALVFCGTSFSVQLTETALDFAKERSLPVFNFNLHDALQPTARLNAINILGPAAETLPLLMATCREVKEEMRQRPSRACTRKKRTIFT